VLIDRIHSNLILKAGDALSIRATFIRTPFVWRNSSTLVSLGWMSRQVRER
jgi:hypothetical protein